MKQIPYKNKKTGASTIYCDVSPDDKQWVIDKCREITLLEQALRSANLNATADEITKPRKSLPRQGSGKSNSIQSAADGVLDNLTKGTQRNLSHKTRDLLSKSFKEMNNIIPNFEEVEFVEQSKAGVDIDMEPSGTTLSDLFDIDSITITYRKK